jgi:hypothetical protein
MHASLLGFFLSPHMLNKMDHLQLLYYGCLVVEVGNHVLVII